MIKKYQQYGFVIHRQTPKIWKVQKPDGEFLAYTFPTLTDAKFYCRRNERFTEISEDRAARFVWGADDLEHH